jgi:hypothetical protein
MKIGRDFLKVRGTSGQKLWMTIAILSRSLPLHVPRFNHFWFATSFSVCHVMIISAVAQRLATSGEDDAIILVKFTPSVPTADCRINSATATGM